MERLIEKLTIAKKAVLTLQALEKEAYSEIVRDASIQRFEYSFEAVWKAAKQYLKEVEGLDISSPKGVIRACFQIQILDEKQTELALEMVDDRNLTSHTYNEAVSDKIYVRIDIYRQIMLEWLTQLENRF